MVNEIVSETCLLGPVAAMYGREFQQFLLTKKGETVIAVDEMEYSVNCGRASLSNKKLDDLAKEVVASNAWGNRSSPASTRTRTPPRGKSGQSRAPWKEPVRSSHLAYHREEHVRNTYDDRYRNTDIRNRPDYDRLRQQLRDYHDRTRRTQHRGSYTPEESDGTDPFPAEEEEPRGSMGRHHHERPAGAREPRHYDRDRARELRGYHKDETHRPRRRD